MTRSEGKPDRDKIYRNATARHGGFLKLGVPPVIRFSTINHPAMGGTPMAMETTTSPFAAADVWDLSSSFQAGNKARDINLAECHGTGTWGSGAVGTNWKWNMFCKRIDFETTSVKLPKRKEHQFYHGLPMVRNLAMESPDQAQPWATLLRWELWRMRLGVLMVGWKYGFVCFLRATLPDLMV